MNFSTPDFSTMNFLNHGIERCMVKKSRVEMSFHLIERRHFNPRLFNIRIATKNFSIPWFKNSRLKSLCWKFHGWKIWSWKVQGWSLWLESPGLRCPSTTLIPYPKPHIDYDMEQTVTANWLTNARHYNPRLVYFSPNFWNSFMYLIFGLMYG